jgi:hypothetical protein
MTTQRFGIALVALNLVALLLVAAQTRPTTAQPAATVLRAQALELVDERGVVRSRLEVKPGGEVLLQLFDQKGVIKVKLGAGETGSGMFLADETTQSGVQIIARQTPLADRPQTTSVTLTGKNGATRVIAP